MNMQFLPQLKKFCYGYGTDKQTTFGHIGLLSAADNKSKNFGVIDPLKTTA